MAYKNWPKSYEVVNLLPDVGVLGERGIELDHDPVQPVLQENDPLTDVAFLSGS
jgi:hypothetical protein